MKTSIRLNPLVRNETATTPPKCQNLIVNLLPKLARHDSMEGKDYIVVPMVMLTEGVHRGSEGKLYYPPEELSKTPVVWNHKPVVVYHPEINGVGVSACDPSILTNHKVGVVMNTKWEAKTGRLKAEAWLEPERANIVDPRIMEAVNTNSMMELSTGVFVDSESSPGKWGKEDYEGIARNYRPDHLAILPDKIGACSIKDGAGFLRNQSSDPSSCMAGSAQITGASGPDRVGGRPNKTERENKKRVSKMMEGDPNAPEPGVGGESSMQMMEEGGGFRALLVKMAKKLGITEDLSFDYVRTQIGDALRADFGTDKPSFNGPSPWVQDVFQNFFVYEYKGLLYRLSYETSDDGVTLGDEDPVEVERTPPQYRPVQMSAGGITQNQNNMNKEQIVSNLIANSNGALTEADRPRLLAFTEDQLKKISVLPAQNAAAPIVNKAAAADDDPDNEDNEDEADAPPKKGKGKGKANNQAETEDGGPVSLQDYVSNAPHEIQEVLTNGVNAYNEEKDKIVKRIAAVKNSGYSEKELSAKPLGELRKLARLASVHSTEQSATALNFAGLAPVGNSEEVTNQEVLLAPTMNFDKTTTVK